MSIGKKSSAVFLAWLILWSQTASVSVAAQSNAGNASQPSLDEAVKLSYDKIEELAEKFDYDKSAIDAKIKEIEEAGKDEKERAKKAQKEYDAKIKANEKKLKDIPQSISDTKAVADRQNILCENVATKKDAARDVVASLEKQIAYDVAASKFELLRDWKEARRRIDREIKDGTIEKRTLGHSKTPIGNVLDIGSRGNEPPFKDQEQDIKLGQEAVREAKMRGEIFEEIKDPVIAEYVNRLAQNIARNSDLTVPLQVHVIRKTEERDGRPVLDKDGSRREVANAMALPGGIMYVYIGIIEEAASESELAGVLAHEISHAAARHSHQLMHKATIEGLILQSVQIATLFIPGLGLGLYYAINYALQGAGLLFTLNLLGVSREHELQADQLGAQYAWHAGYDPAGFTTLFGRMAEERGYASHTSFFYDHPAFGERIMIASREEAALRSVDPNRELTTNTSEFDGIKERTRKLIDAESAIETENEKNGNSPKPSLYAKEKKEEEACKNILPAAPSSARHVPDTPIVTSATKTDEAVQPEEKRDEEDKPPVLKRKDEQK